MNGVASAVAEPRPGSGRLLHGRAVLLALSRRRVTVAILVAMPLVMYLVSHEAVGRSIRSLVFGVTWAVSTVSFFAAVSGRELEPRLRLAGRSAPELIVGRLAALMAAALGLAAVFWVLVVIDQPIDNPTAMALDFAVSAVVSVALGSAVGAVIGKELEGVLVLFFLAALGAVVNPFEPVAKFLPFWSTRELGTYAVDGAAVGSLGWGLAHAAVAVGLCTVAIAAATRRAGRTVTARG